EWLKGFDPGPIDSSTKTENVINGRFEVTRNSGDGYTGPKVHCYLECMPSRYLSMIDRYMYVPVTTSGGKVILIRVCVIEHALERLASFKNEAKGPMVYKAKSNPNIKGYLAAMIRIRLPLDSTFTGLHSDDSKASTTVEGKDSTSISESDTPRTSGSLGEGQPS
ncbi:MAG: hypothetical protein P1U42_11670, partial [Phycisphaerales bacterium]|nr:hypothetical protein [Phycisphaerales bacterium]